MRWDGRERGGRRKLTFGRDASSNLNVGFLHDHASFNRLSSSPTVLGSEHPLAIGVGESVNWDDADSGLVITAISRAESYTPSRP